MQTKLSPQQQVQLAQQVSNELDKMTMSWTNELRKWHPFAMRALEHANLQQLNVPSSKYNELFKVEDHGINMNIVAVLANNIEQRTPAEMGLSAVAFRSVIELNDEIGRNWNALVEPVRKKVAKEFEIMTNKPKLVIAGEA